MTIKLTKNELRNQQTRLKTAEKELKEQDKFDYRIHSNTRDEDFAALTSITDRERKARM